MSMRSSISAFGAAFVVALFAATTFTTAAFADDEANISTSGTAIHGYDPVAYFDPGMPVKGNDDYTATHDGVVYWFSSAVNQQKFKADPDKYVPSYGGWCAYGVRVGKKFDVDPHAWKIVGGRLYMQLDLGTQKVWTKDLTKNIEIADRLWPQIQSTPAKVLGN